MRISISNPNSMLEKRWEANSVLDPGGHRTNAERASGEKWEGGSVHQALTIVILNKTKTVLHSVSQNESESAPSQTLRLVFYFSTGPDGRSNLR